MMELPENRVRLRHVVFVAIAAEFENSEKLGIGQANSSFGNTSLASIKSKKDENANCFHVRPALKSFEF